MENFDDVKLSLLCSNIQKYKNILNIKLEKILKISATQRGVCVAL